jgi:hypothetical protein
MDASEPSTNGISASNLYRLSSVLNDDTYSKKAKETVAGFESEMMQYPWYDIPTSSTSPSIPRVFFVRLSPKLTPPRLFASFMPSIVASHLGLKGVVVSSGDGIGDAKIKAFEKQPRGGLGTFAKLDTSSSWLRQRNSLLKDFGLDGRPRVMTCEGGVCREEGLETGSVGTGEGLDVGGLAGALPDEKGDAESFGARKEERAQTPVAAAGENAPLS